MAFNIKNDETQRLARTLATATGETVTGAITVALRERLARVSAGSHEQSRGKAERLHAVAKDAARRWRAEQLDVDHAELLYDEHGLPR